MQEYEYTAIGQERVDYAVIGAYRDARMDRTEFETLRDLPGKYIEGNVRLTLSPNTAPVLCADDITIHNALGLPATLNITFNPEADAFKCNVHVKGVGAIYRIEINGPEHPGAGRTHKHALRTERCPKNNLPRDVTRRPDLDGLSLQQAWEMFCAMASIDHRGTFSCENFSITDPL